MATDSADHSRSFSDNGQNPVHQKNDESTVANIVDPTLSSASSPFVNSEPMREEQVENAVKFLEHPKVRGSPVIYRRSFLEKKGLTKEEIDEAFRRVPDPSAMSEGQPKPSTNIQLQGSQSNLQFATPAPAGVISAGGVTTKPRFQWSHFFLTLGVVATFGTGTTILVKSYLIPWLKSWIQKVTFERESDIVRKKSKEYDVIEEAVAAAKEAAAAAAYVAKANLEILNSKSADSRSFEERMNQFDSQLKETMYMLKSSGTNEARSSSLSSHVEPSTVHPKSFMDVMAMVQRGESPPNIKDINDMPPDPTQPLPNPRLHPRPKPWELGEAQNGGANGEYTPWKQQRNVRITEIEADGERSSDLPPPQRMWVPPQPPPISMPEAAAAIRQTKKVRPLEGVLSDDVAMAQYMSASDELQSDAGVSESGGLDVGGSNGCTPTEICEEV